MLDLKLTNWDGVVIPKKIKQPKRVVVEKYVPEPIPQIKLPTVPKLETPKMP